MYSYPCGSSLDFKKHLIDWTFYAYIGFIEPCNSKIEVFGSLPGIKDFPKYLEWISFFCNIYWYNKIVRFEFFFKQVLIRSTAIYTISIIVLTYFFYISEARLLRLSKVNSIYIHTFANKNKCYVLVFILNFLTRCF